MFCPCQAERSPKQDYYNNRTLRLRSGRQNYIVI